MEEKFALLVDALPETGDVSYEEWYNTLQATQGGRQALKVVHQARRDGVLEMGQRKSGFLIARPGQLRTKESEVENG